MNALFRILTTAESRPEARRRAPGFLSALAAMAISVIACYFCLSLQFSEAFAILNIALPFAFISLHLLHSPLDLTSPMPWFNLAMASMYGLHPLYVLHDEGLLVPYHQFYDISRTYSQAILLGGAAIVAGNIGFRPWRRCDLPTSSTASSPDGFPPLAVPLNTVLSVLGLLGLSRFNFMTTHQDPAGASALDGQTAYLYMLPQLLLPAGLVWIALGKRSLGSVYTPLGAILLTVYLSNLALGGSRFTLISGLGSVAIYLGLSSRRTLRRPLLLLAVPALLLFMGALRDVNAPNHAFATALTASVSNPARLVEQSLAGEDTEMVDALALEMSVVPSILPYGPGTTAVATLAAPIPRRLWHDKPIPPDVILNQLLFHRGINQPYISYALVGEWYYEAGATGVAAAFLVYGALCRRLQMGRLIGSPRAILTYALLIPLLNVWLRGSTALMVSYLLTSLGPLALLKGLSWRPRTQPDKSGHARALSACPDSPRHS